MKPYKLYTDGSYQKSLKIAAIGGYLLDPDGNLVFDFSERIDDNTSFKYHEALALLYGLDKAISHGVKNLECFSDDRSIHAIFNRKYLSEESSQINPVRENIFALKGSFEHIEFHHLPRKLNKLADKLAGKYLKAHKDTITAQKKRHDFIGREEQLMYVPNLLCEEDFHANSNLKIFSAEKKQLEYFYFFDTQRVSGTEVLFSSYLLRRNLKNFKQLEITSLREDTLPVKHFFVQGMEIMTSVFTNSVLQDKNIGIIFNDNDELSFKRIDLVLRKRGILHYPQANGVLQFVDSVKKFNKIILDNDEKIIHQVMSHHHINDHSLQAEKTQTKLQHYLDILKEITADNYYLGKNPDLEKPFNSLNNNTLERLQKRCFGEFVKISLASFKLTLPEGVSFNLEEKIVEIRTKITQEGIKLKI